MGSLYKLSVEKLIRYGTTPFRTHCDVNNIIHIVWIIVPLKEIVRYDNTGVGFEDIFGIFVVGQISDISFSRLNYQASIGKARTRTFQ